jgi:hypothetical protein
MSYLLSLGLKNVEVFYMIRINRKNEFGRSPLLAKTWNKESYREAVSYIQKVSAIFDKNLIVGNLAR